MTTALLLALLGFGALAAGVLIGRYYVPDDRGLRRSAGHARAYMRAINHLLSRDRDAAVDELKDVVADDVDDLEPYFALGALFRSRGEWERAIRVHQAIELRGGRDRAVRERARYELGLDFRAAGMPRRATRAFEECVSDDARHAGALRALSGLYEEQGRYAEAASAWRRLDKVTGAGNARREHHLLTAAGQLAIAAGDVGAAKRLLRDAERIDPESPHLLVAEADLAAARGDAKGARKRLLAALAAAPDLASTLADSLAEAERDLLPTERDAPDDDDDRDGRAARAAAESMTALAAGQGDSPQLRLAAAGLLARVDPEQALRQIRAVADAHPELLVARIGAARLALAEGDEEAVRGELRALVGPGGTLAWADRGRFRCAGCGQVEGELFWRCERCRRWGGARLELGDGVLEPAGEAPRERRALPRRRLAELPGERALPAPRLAGGPDEDADSDSDADEDSRPGLVSKASGWLSGALSSARRRPPS